jgi:hypothetical protein
MNCGAESCRIIEEEKPTETWRVVLAVLLFPIGLLFLFTKGRQNVKYCPECGHKENI